MIDGKAAYVYFVSPTQIDVIAAPDSTSGPVSVIVTNNGVPSTSENAQLQIVAPAFFSAGKYVIATHADWVSGWSIQFPPRCHAGHAG
jgi:uncharacterized protein (TIGR03437 family)